MKKKVSDIIYIKIYNDMYTTIYDKLKNKTSAIMYGSYVIKYHSSYNQITDQLLFNIDLKLKTLTDHYVKILVLCVINI